VELRRSASRRTSDQDSVQPDQSALDAAIRQDLAQCGLVAEKIVFPDNDRADWHVRIHVAGRRFELGSDRADGFFCREITDGRHRNFVYPDSGPVRRRPDQLRREGLAMIQHALRHPEFEGATYPVI
jgi:hypothetical protein